MFEHLHHFQQLLTFDNDGDSLQIRGLAPGSSCVGTNSCGALFNTAPSDTAGLWFGATHLQSTDSYGNSEVYNQGKGWLSDDVGLSLFTSDADAAVAGSEAGMIRGGHFLVGSNQGMYSNFSSINAYWSDTTAMDNLRAADITDSSVAGSIEVISSKNVDHTASSSTFNA